ncbi:hypothetical protein OAD51_01575 [Flavobacteriaceae bacterium]|nr:hypothetical protein [Flavobacteriaceae bacterium]
MKKALVLLAITFTSLVSAQWEKSQYYDEFGDPTGEEILIQTVVGTFSNSVTTDSPARYVMIDTNKYITISIYEYNGNTKNTSAVFSGGFVNARIKTPSGDKLEVKLIAAGDGMLYFTKKYYKNFKKVTQEKGDYTFILMGSGNRNCKFIFSI